MLTYSRAKGISIAISRSMLLPYLARQTIGYQAENLRQAAQPLGEVHVHNIWFVFRCPLSNPLISSIASLYAKIDLHGACYPTILPCLDHIYHINIDRINKTRYVLAHISISKSGGNE